MAFILSIVLTIGLIGVNRVLAIPGVSNDSVSNAIDSMTASGSVPTDPNSVYWLDFSSYPGKADIVGEVDIDELKTVFPNLDEILFDDTNIVSIVNDSAFLAAGGTISSLNTFANGDKTIVSTGETVVYRASDGSLSVSNLLSKLKIRNSVASGLGDVAIPSSVIEDALSITLGGATISATKTGSIAASDMPAVAGTYPAALTVTLSGTSVTQTANVNIQVRRPSYTLSPSGTASLYKGGSRTFTFRKISEEGLPVTHAIADYDFDYITSGTGVSGWTTPTISGDGLNIYINLTAE
jgi:hypothetical protein